MHSSWKIWDLFKSRPKIINNESPRLIALQSWDAFAFKLIKDKIPREILSENKLYVISGKDVTVDWLEDNLKSLGLFGNSESYLILDAHQMSKNCKDVLREIDDLILDDRYLFLEYSKDDDLLKTIKSHEKAELIKVQAPGFWELERLLDFLCDELGVYLDLSAKELIHAKVTADIGNFYNVLTQIGINYPDKVNITGADINGLIKDVKTDQFELANDFASKKLKVFYEKLSGIYDFDDLRQTFMFLQSHLLKVYDPDYTIGKNRLTKYDKEVIAQSKIWKKNDLDKALQYFSRLEIQAKKKDPFLMNLIQKDRLRVLN